jgi:hypothetical protein
MAAQFLIAERAADQIQYLGESGIEVTLLGFMECPGLPAE